MTNPKKKPVKESDSIDIALNRRLLTELELALGTNKRLCQELSEAYELIEYLKKNKPH
jgi:hypothetical protein